MAICYVLCGIPGSGKTTLSHQLAEQHNAIVHSYDDIPNAWGNRDIDGSFYKQWMDNIKNDLRSGNSVVCDSTALTSYNRKEFLKDISEFNCEKILVVKVVPIEVCVQRNQNRQARVPDFAIEQAARLLEAPTKDEGWDKILVYRD